MRKEVKSRRNEVESRRPAEAGSRSEHREMAGRQVPGDKLWVCVDCGEVFHHDPLPCPKCGSYFIIVVSKM